MPENPPEATSANPVRKFLTGVAIIAVICGCSGYLFINVILPGNYNGMFASMCLRNLKHQAQALDAYCIEFDEILPPKQRGWMDAIKVEGQNDADFHCPNYSPRVANEFGYAANVHLFGNSISVVSDRQAMPLVFDTALVTRNAMSGLETLPFPGRHGISHVRDRNNIAYLDGHVEPLKDDAPKPNDDPSK